MSELEKQDFQEQKKRTVYEIVREYNEIKADIETVTTVVGEALNDIGISVNDFSPDDDIISALPKVITKLTPMMAMGKQPASLYKLQALKPIFDKYAIKAH